jgi:hypothetical protein
MKKQIVSLAIGTSMIIPAALTTGCAVAHHQESVKDYGSDSGSPPGQNCLYKDPAVKGTEVKVITMKGVVQLSGFGDTQQAKERARANRLDCSRGG